MKASNATLLHVYSACARYRVEKTQPIYSERSRVRIPVDSVRQNYPVLIVLTVISRRRRPTQPVFTSRKLWISALDCLCEEVLRPSGVEITTTTDLVLANATVAFCSCKHILSLYMDMYLNSYAVGRREVEGIYRIYLGLIQNCHRVECVSSWLDLRVCNLLLISSWLHWVVA